MMDKNYDLLGECLRQQKPSEEEEEVERPPWMDKPLHRMYQWKIEEEADIENKYQKLGKAGIKDISPRLQKHELW